MSWIPAFNIQTVSLVIFACALLHTFATAYFERLAHRYPAHAGFLHLLGEVEVVFGFWAMVLMLMMAWIQGAQAATHYLETRQYTEPLFVFVVMCIAASRPILLGVQAMLRSAARVLPMPAGLAQIFLGMSLLPLLGSLITEPAAMTVAALLLAPLLFHRPLPEWLKYAALGVLFVNISIGGTLTNFAAPPVLMVAKAWGWSSADMLLGMGWKAAIAVGINAAVFTAVMAYTLKRTPSIADIDALKPNEIQSSVPWVLVAIHGLFLAAVILFSHHPIVFSALFLFFMGFTEAYARHQSPLILRQALLVAFFLGGLVVLGGMQQWWLGALIRPLSPDALFFGALTLTAITDNAALTYLGSLIPELSAASRYALVAGAVAGGGLTVIANAPNLAGVTLLKTGFRDNGIGAFSLLCGALLPTAVAALCLWLL